MLAASCLIEEKGAAEHLAPGLKPSHLAICVSLEVDWKRVQAILGTLGSCAGDLRDCQDGKAVAQPADNGIALSTAR